MHTYMLYVMYSVHFKNAHTPIDRLGLAVY